MLTSPTDELKGSLLEMGICQVLIPLTNSASSEVQGNSAAALGNLSSKDGRAATDDYSAFNDVWDTPEGGMHQYLYRFLCSPDATFQHIAVWTIVQLLESGGKPAHGGQHMHTCSTLPADAQLNSNIRNSPILIPTIRQMASSRPGSPGSSVGDGTLHSGRSRSRHSYQDTEEGQGEIQLLARRILEFTDGDAGDEGSTPVRTGSVAATPAGEHDELRKSVRDAFVSSSYRSGR
jgi:vacuolar protein 8